MHEVMIEKGATAKQRDPNTFAFKPIEPKPDNAPPELWDIMTTCVRISAPIQILSHTRSHTPHSQTHSLTLSHTRSHTS